MNPLNKSTLTAFRIQSTIIFRLPPKLASLSHNSLATVSDCVHTRNVIELIKEHIPSNQEAKLRLWLARGEAETLRKVLAAKCQFAQAEALQKAIVAQSGDTADLLSQVEMQDAARFHTALTILNEIAAQPPEEHFFVAKLKTHTNDIATNVAESED